MGWLYTHWTYLGILLVSILGLVVLDWRYKLVGFGSDPSSKQKALGMTLLIMTGTFLVWDLLGILLGIFFTNQAYVIGLHLPGVRDLPVEEILFLILLNYSCLIVVAGVELWQSKQKGAR